MVLEGFMKYQMVKDLAIYGKYFQACVFLTETTPQSMLLSYYIFL